MAPDATGGIAPVSNPLPAAALAAAAVSPEHIVPELTSVSRIYCGREVPGGGTVDDATLAGFVAAEVASRFPAGFTVLHGNGGWRDVATGATITERSVVFEVFHGAADLETVRDVARAYKAAFRQDAVGLTTTPVAVQFI